MIRFQVTWYFTSYNSGWRETAWITKSTLELALIAAKHMCQFRAELNGREADLVLDKVLVVTAPEELGPDLDFDTNNRYFPYGPFKDSLCDMPWIGVQANLHGVGNVRRTWILRGLPDEVTRQDWDVPISNTDWLDRFGTWVAKLVENGFQMRRHNREQVKTTITGIAANADGQLVVTSPAHGLTTGDYITPYRIVSSGTCIKGKQQVVTLTPNTFIMGNHNVGSTVFDKGQYYIPEYVYFSILRGEVGRKTQLPTGSSHQRIVAKKTRCKKK